MIGLLQRLAAKGDIAANLQQCVRLLVSCKAKGRVFILPKQAVETPGWRAKLPAPGIKKGKAGHYVETLIVERKVWGSTSKLKVENSSIKRSYIDSNKMICFIILVTAGMIHILNL